MEKFITKIQNLEDYSVTKDGKVYSYKSGKRVQLKTNFSQKAGEIVYLGKMGIGVHRLIALEFLDKPIDKNIVIHIDDNKKNNTISNLRWVNEQDLQLIRVNKSLKIIPKSNLYEKRLSSISQYSHLKGYTVTKDGKIYSYLDGVKLQLKPSCNNGYLQVSIGFRPNKTTVKIHRLVALAFLDNPLNYPQVNHIDGNKSNNLVENLEWCNNSQNQRHAILNKLKTSTQIEKYSLNDEYIQTYASMFQILEEFDISSDTSIRLVCDKQQTQAYGYKWKYRTK